MQASAQGIDFQAADVFFTLCMLQLPQQSMATFFVRSVQSYAELMASLDRMAPLLAVKDRKEAPESRDPPQERAASPIELTDRSHKNMSSVETQQQEVRLGVSLLCACLHSLTPLLWASLLCIYHCWNDHGRGLFKLCLNILKITPSEHKEGCRGDCHVLQVVVMQGGCYKWLAMQPVQISGVQEDSRHSLTALSGVNLSVKLGELVCVCGEVGPFATVSHQSH